VLRNPDLAASDEAEDTLQGATHDGILAFGG